MSATILTQQTDQGMQLSNAAGARVMGIGTSWNRIRIGARVCATDSGSALTGTPRFYIGVQAGAVNNPLSGSASTHFVGKISGASDWSRSGNTYSTFAGQQSGKVVGTTITGAGSSVGDVFPWTTFRLYAKIVEIEKGSPNYTLSTINCNSTNAATVDFLTLISAMETSSFSGIAAVLGSGYVATTGASLAVDEGADGALNSVCIAWNRATVEVFYAEVVYSVFA